VRGKAFFNVLIEFVITMKLARLRVRVDKHFTDNLSIQNDLKKRGYFITTVFQFCFGICHYGGPGKSGGPGIK
jgi:hypothetical protein